jgi:uncharacterized membrane protein
LPDAVGDCPDDAESSWADVEPVFAAHCTRCHDADLEGEERSGAPEHIHFDSAEDARLNDFLTWSMVWSARMPPDRDGMSDDEAWVVWEWLSCGGPE